MNSEVLQDTLEGSGVSAASVTHGRGASVALMGGTEPDEAWFDDPDAHYAEVVDYMRRLYRRCDSAEEFIGALSGLFPDLEDKFARINAGAEIAFGHHNEADATAELGPGPWICFPITAELTALNLAQIAGPDRRGAVDQPDEAWFDDPDAHYDDVMYYIERLHVRCDSSDEFIAALSGLLPNLEDKVAEVRALIAEDLDDDDLPDPDADIAAGRGVTFLSGTEMIATELAMLSDPAVCD